MANGVKDSAMKQVVIGAVVSALVGAIGYGLVWARSVDQGSQAREVRIQVLEKKYDNVDQTLRDINEKLYVIREKTASIDERVKILSEDSKHPQK